MKIKLLAGWLALNCLLGSARADEAWDPAHTWVFMVGVLEFKDSSLSTYPQKNRRDADLIALLGKRGVPKEQIHFLKDKDATLNHIEKELADFASRASGTLIVYYDGHGACDRAGSGFFMPYDSGERWKTGWSVSSLVKTVESKFKGTRTIYLADCCHSGSLALEAAKHKGSFACLTSCQHDENSTGNWTFTESLLAGFGGDPRVDLNQDGKITLSELAAFAEQEMAFAEGQLSSYSKEKSAPDLVLSKAPPTPNSHYGERVILGADDDADPVVVLEAEKHRLKVRSYGYHPKEKWISIADAHPWQPKDFAVGQKVLVLGEADPLREAAKDAIKFHGSILENKLGVHLGKKSIESSTWYDAVVLNSKLGVPFIHYNAYGSSFDEWVSPEIVKPRP